MDRDGARTGFDLALTRAVVDAVDVPVIASGGVGSLQDLVDGIVVGGADAVLAASIFHYGEFTIGQAKAAMAAAGHRSALIAHCAKRAASALDDCGPNAQNTRRLDGQRGSSALDMDWLDR